MNDFLDFLNNADFENLNSLPWMNKALAERLIAARPFATLEDCLKVRGMNQKLLERLKAAFAERAALNANQPRLPEPVRPAAEPPAALPARLEPISQPHPAATDFWTRMQRAFLVFLRVLLVLFFIFLLVGGIGAAIYFGLPYLQEKYVQPIEQNSANISALATVQMGNLEAMSTQVADLQDQIAALQQQIETANQHTADLEKAIADHTAALAKLEQVQAELDDAAAQQRDSLLIELKHQVMLTRAIEILSRGRLFLSQSNFGLAKADVQACRDLLAELQTEVPAYQAESLAAVLARLDLALGNLPDYPVIAVDDVDIAWNLLIIGLPESAAEAAALAITPTPPSTPDATATPEQTPTPTLTPTP